ncbi:MAG: type I-E CRISPR-associated protein Cse2/CasB, partial [Deinococcota bacterium]|nr:type I-E CRISPR-associated protein Cse2/CasB [Deinococcota bacterium]
RQELEANFGKESSLEKRFFHLLENERHELSYPLRQWFGLIKAANLNVDCIQLLQDITYWKERTKDTWARDFYRTLRDARLLQAPDTTIEEETV